MVVNRLVMTVIDDELKLPVTFVVHDFCFRIGISQFQVALLTDYLSGLWVIILGQAPSFGTEISQLQSQVEREFSITPMIMIKFTEVECAQLVDNVEHGPSLAGDVKFGLVGKLLSPKLAIENTVVRTFSNIRIKEQTDVFPLKNAVY
ncbi:hypothetical protein V6N11_082723 [Hibiscus sabdariffa]|uniref:Uncharacterized protein n=1 Tax=Hibiscus sabdariffa TaxID=183260 RepID=A0ABR2QJT1_9ROSI